jgi:ATP-dependent DNA ligase
MTHDWKLSTPVQPPIEPMLAQLTRELPDGHGWLFEPKWDGFRALLFWDGRELLLQSRDKRPLGRYFPELEDHLAANVPAGVVLDGEIVIAGRAGLDFDALLLRIHPATSRNRLLASQTPASFVAFDVLAADGNDLREAPLADRRHRLEALLGAARAPFYLTPATTDRQVAGRWFEHFEGAGLDGVVAKRLELPYRPGERVMLKVKHLRTAECVVAGFRWNKDQTGVSVGSLLLGLYDGSSDGSTGGELHHVGFTSTFKAAEKRALVGFLEPYRSGAPGSAERGPWPGGMSRWSPGRELETQPLRPELVCEVAFDHWQGPAGPPRPGGRFRHGTTFLRWRPDKPPRACTFDQLGYGVPAELNEIFGT